VPLTTPHRSALETLVERPQRGFQGELILYGDWTKFATTEAMQPPRIANISSRPQDWGSLERLRTSLPSVG
jgi:hypothetical protein